MAKVLLVDDSPSILRSVEIALTAAGHEVMTAQSAEEALGKAQADVPDVMVVDVMMPGGTEGFDLVWTVRQSENATLKAVPIIMATAVAEQTGMAFFPSLPDGLFEPGAKLDVQAWLDKPIRPQLLLETIASLTGAE